MRAKLPETEGFAERNGNRIHYEVYGQGPQTMVFLPPWSIVHSRIYKAQIPYFSERYRCITYDPRGNGKSDRPAEAAAYSLENYVADALRQAGLATGSAEADGRVAVDGAAPAEPVEVAAENRRLPGDRAPGVLPGVEVSQVAPKGAAVHPLGARVWESIAPGHEGREVSAIQRHGVVREGHQ